MKITTKNLEVIFKKTIEKLESENVLEVEVSEDFYRFIPTDEWDSYDAEILVGSLFDDVESLMKHTENNDRVYSYVDMDRLASILRYISNKQSPV